MKFPVFRGEHINFLARLTLGQPAVCPKAIRTLTEQKVYVYVPSFSRIRAAADLIGPDFDLVLGDFRSEPGPNQAWGEGLGGGPARRGRSGWNGPVAPRKVLTLSLISLFLWCSLLPWSSSISSPGMLPLRWTEATAGFFLHFLPFFERGLNTFYTFTPAWRRRYALGTSLARLSFSKALPQRQDASSHEALRFIVSTSWLFHGSFIVARPVEQTPLFVGNFPVNPTLTGQS